MWESLVDVFSFDSLSDNLKNNQFLITGVIGAVTTTIALYGRRIWNRILHYINRWLVYNEHVEDDNDLFNIVGTYMNENYAHQYRNSILSYKTRKRYNEWGDEIFEPSDIKLKRKHYSDYYWIYWKRKPIFVTCSRTEIQGARDTFNSHKYAYKFSSIFGKDHIETFIKDIIKHHEEKTKDEFVPFLYTPNYRNWDRQTAIKKRGLDTVISNVKDEIIQDIDNFLASRDFYDRRGISFKRTYLFEGKPGNGKTSFIKTLSTKFNRNLYMLNVRDLTSDVELQHLCTSVQPGSILIMEDFDSYFEGRDSKIDTMSGGISFSALLNVLDGVFDLDDIIIIITTNKPETLSNAILRPGRIDKRFYFDNPDLTNIESYLTMWYEEDIDVSKYNKSMSFSELEGLCRSNTTSTIVEAIEKFKPKRNKII